MEFGGFIEGRKIAVVLCKVMEASIDAGTASKPLVLRRWCRIVSPELPLSRESRVDGQWCLRITKR